MCCSFCPAESSSVSCFFFFSSRRRHTRFDCDWSSDVCSSDLHVGSGIETGIKTIAKSIDEAHAACKGFDVKIALEITAGQGSNLGHTFEEMSKIFDAVVENERLR